MLRSLDAFERYLHAKSDLPALVRLALIHYQFEAIHPFWDGNGRIGRLLITLLLCSEGVLPGPLLYLSAYIEKHRPQYYSGLLAVSQRGAWDEWIMYFLRGVAESAMDAVDRASRLIALRETYRQRLVQPRASAHLLSLVDHLFSSPAITVPHAARFLKVTQKAAQSNINKLVDAGIVAEATGKRRGRVYIAHQIVRSVQ